MFDAPHIPSQNLNNDAPTKHPTTFSEQVTFEPTSKMKGWRLKSAKIDTNETMKYWKTNTPDEVPPLPPDTDPETGEKLPPVIAYVTTLTKCGPKHRGGLDGAAVLLHSIRRNSYGWTPLQEQYTKANVALNSADGTPTYGGNGGRYRYRAYVIVDPVASPHIKRRAGECARYLQKLGYIILHRPPLVPLFPEVPEVPVEPLVPLTRDKPFVPVLPDVPAVPDDPLVPDSPLVLLAPLAPLVPAVPVEPLVPLTPEVLLAPF